MARIVDCSWRLSLDRRWELVETRVVATVEPDPGSTGLGRLIWRAGERWGTCGSESLAKGMAEEAVYGPAWKR